MATAMTISRKDANLLTTKANNGLKINHTNVFLFPFRFRGLAYAPPPVPPFSQSFPFPPHGKGKEPRSSIRTGTLLPRYRTDPPHRSCRLSTLHIKPDMHGAQSATHHPIPAFPHPPSILHHHSSSSTTNIPTNPNPNASNTSNTTWQPRGPHAYMHPSDACIDLRPPHNHRLIRSRSIRGYGLHPFIRSFLFRRTICLLAQTATVETVASVL